MRMSRLALILTLPSISWIVGSATLLDDIAIAQTPTWTATWSQAAAEAPHREFGAATFLPGRCELLAFGGRDLQLEEYVADTLLYDPVRDQWTTLPAQKRGPSWRSHPGLNWDPNRGVAVMFGGHRLGAMQDTWGFDPSTRKWSQLVGACGRKTVCPPARNMHGQAWSSVREATLVFGGFGNTAYGDLWELRSDVNRRGNVTWTWSRLDPTPDPVHGVPVPRQGIGMVEIEAGTEQGKMLIYGGFETGSWQVFRDTWLYDPEANSYTWVDVPSPTAAYGFAMVWSPSLHAVVINGGQPDNGVLTEETWAFDAANLMWVPVETNADVPEARGFHELVSNTCDGSAMLYGPAQGATSNGTWVLR